MGNNWLLEHYRALFRSAAGVTTIGLWATALGSGGDMSAVIPLLALGWLFSAVSLITFSELKPLYRALGVLLLTVFLGGTWWYIKATHPAVISEPHLAATLVVDSEDDHTFPNFHIELANDQGPDVRILQYAYKTPKFSDAVILTENMKSTIPKGGKITIPGKLASGVAAGPTNLEMALAYETLDRPAKSYHSFYRFFVDHQVKTSERFNPINWQDGAGTIREWADK